MNKICDHSNYSDYFERCEDCGATRNDIITTETSTGKMYLALYDTQNDSYMHSGRNSRTLEELKTNLIGYIEGAADTEQWDYKKMSVFDLAEVMEMEVCHQPEPFNED